MADGVQHASDEAVAEEILTMLRKILASDAITLTDDFFVAGGDSLAGLELTMAVEARFGLKLDPVEIFDRPVIGDFAAAVSWLINNGE